MKLIELVNHDIEWWDEFDAKRWVIVEYNKKSDEVSISGSIDGTFRRYTFYELVSSLVIAKERLEKLEYGT